MQRLVWLFVLLCVAMGSTQTVFAHGGRDHSSDEHGQIDPTRRGPSNWEELAWAWEFEPWVVAPLVLSAYLYVVGTVRIWRDAGVGHGIRQWEAAVFAAGWLALVVALVSPIHPWGSMLFSAHMTQHEILMLVGAPLLVLGKPLVGILKGLPRGWARIAVRWTRVAWWQRIWHFITGPVVAWVIHTAVLWIWHIPVLFEATLTNEFVHALQHLSFVLSALLFWWAVMQGPHRALNFGVAVLYMFTTALHSGALGAILTFAGSVWYPAYAETAPVWGLTPLEDQQLGGIIMWIPACTVYIIAGLALIAASLQHSERRVRQWELLSAPIDPVADLQP